MTKNGQKWLKEIIYIYNEHLLDGFERPKSACGQIKLPKYVCLVDRLGEQLLEKQILKKYSRYSLIKWYQFFISIIQHEQYYLTILIIGLKAAT